MARPRQPSRPITIPPPGPQEKRETLRTCAGCNGTTTQVCRATSSASAYRRRRCPWCDSGEGPCGLMSARRHAKYRRFERMRASCPGARWEPELP